MKKGYFIVILLATIIFGGTFTFYNIKNEYIAKAYADRETRPVIATTIAKKGSIIPNLSSVGTLISDKSITVTSQVPGQIKTIYFDSGQMVNQGQTLLKLDDRIPKLVYEMDLANLKYAKENYIRQKNLYKSKATSKEAKDQAEVNYLVQKSITEKDKINLENNTITAPFCGKIGLKKISIGQSISTSTQLVTLEQVDPLYVDFTIPSKNINNIKIGQKIYLQVDQVNNKKIHATISSIDNTVNAQTRNLSIRAKLDNKNLELYPGQFASITILLPKIDNLVLVPRTAIINSIYGDTVFVVNTKDNIKTVSEKNITSGYIQDENISITSGVDEGDQIVISGQNKLQSGDEVLINNDENT